MSSPDKGAGPQLTQDVLYQVTGTHVIVPGTINGINADGTVNIISWSPGSTGNDRASVPYAASLDRTAASDNKWTYPQFQ
jgi:hypothetical protein